MRALKQNDPRSWLRLRMGKFYLDTSTAVKLVVSENGVNRAAEMVD